MGVLVPEKEEATPLIDAQLSLPACLHEGTLSWTVQISNPGSDDDFTVFLVEADTGDGRPRPVGIKLSGRYPSDLDGLVVLLSLDMAIIDVAWVAMKLRKLLNYAEPLSAFHAVTPGTGKMERHPSVVAYLARIILHRYTMLGWLTQDGHPVEAMGVMVLEQDAA
jgi:ribonucleoside-diphosphate reductase alpha chain